MLGLCLQDSFGNSESPTKRDQVQLNRSRTYSEDDKGSRGDSPIHQRLQSFIIHSPSRLLQQSSIRCKRIPGILKIVCLNLLRLTLRYFMPSTQLCTIVLTSCRAGRRMKPILVNTKVAKGSLDQ